MSHRIRFLILFFSGVLLVGMGIAQEKKLTGKELYLQNCAACHGQNLEGIPPAFPPLKDIGNKLDEKAIREQIINGKNAMPSFKHLSREEIDAIVAYLLGKEAVAVVEPPATPVELGRRLFVSNCASCHQATIYDPIPEGLPQNWPVAVPAPLAGATKRFTKQQFFMILDHGPMYMPSFAHLTAEEKEALWAYAKSLEGKGEPTGTTFMQDRMKQRGGEHPGRMMGRGRGMGRGMGRMGGGMMRGDHPRGRTPVEYAFSDLAQLVQEHIELGTKFNNGYYGVLDQDTNEMLLLKLVTLRDDRWGKLKNGGYFVCARMADKNGVLYDIDFILVPQRDRLVLTRVLVHAVDGKERYRWKKQNGYWERVPVKE